MLKKLYINNLAIIKNLKIDFSKGMNILTGETGAGKSIIIDAINLLTGHRSSKKLIRKNTNKIMLQGLFIMPKNSKPYHILDDVGIEHNDNNIILQREIYRNGNNICRINGMLVNTNILQKIGENLIEINGQNDNQTLMNPNQHINLLDRFAPNEINTLLNKYQNYYNKYLNIKRFIKRKNENSQQLAQRLDMYKFQIKDIKNADLKENEEKILIQEKKKLSNYQNINQSLQQSLANINGQNGIVPLDMIGEAMNNMQSIKNYDQKFKDISNNIENAYYILQDVVNNIDTELSLQDFDENKLNKIEQRLSLIDNLKIKYGNSIHDILNYYNKILDQYNKLKQIQDGNDNSTKELSKYEDILSSLGNKISNIRSKSASRLEKQVHKQLSDLYMSKTKFKVHFFKNNKKIYNHLGIDNLEFYIQTNPGEGFSPLAQSASGGELSRILLALKTIFVKEQYVDTIIFDEIDTGVSGRVAQSIANKMNRISKNIQVLCITHLPQVAAVGKSHYLIQKRIVKNRTETSIKKLNKQDQIQELARMLAGPKVTELTLKHAKEMINITNQNNK